MSAPIRPPLSPAEEALREVIHDDDCDHLGVADCEYRARRVAALSADSIDVAWREAEAALPRGEYLILWRGFSFWCAGMGREQAYAAHPYLRQTIGRGRTPAAALRALTEKLR